MRLQGRPISPAGRVPPPQILKDAWFVKSRKEGTCVYYYLDPDASQLTHLITLFCDVKEFMKNVPNRSGD